MTQPVLSNSVSEQLRLQVLRSHYLLDTPPEPAYDGLARLAAQICDTPMAIVNLLDEHRQWFKAAVGMPVRETPRDISFCTQVVDADQPLIVADTHLDPRFANNPLVVGPLHIRFYAGLPLRSPLGVTLGTLAVLDRVPRQLTPQQLSLLEDLAQQAMGQMALRFEHCHHRLTALRLAVTQQLSTMDTWQFYVEDKRLLLTEGIYPLMGIQSADFGETLEAFLDLVHPDDRLAVTAAYTETVKAHTPLDIEHRILRPDSDVRCVRLQGRYLPGDSVLPSLIIGTLQDLTTAKQIEAQQQFQQQELRYAHDILRFHVNNSPLAVVEWDSAFRVSRWSSQAEALFGWHEAEVIGLHPSDWAFIHSEEATAVEQVMTELLGGKTHRNISRNRNITRNGEVVYCEWYNSVRFDDDDNLISIFSLVHDVTERVQAEQAMAAALNREHTARAEAEVAKAHFRALFESAPGLYLVLTPDSYQIVAVSEAYLQATLTTRDAIIGRGLFEIFPADPSEPQAEGVTNLRASLERVKTQLHADVMAVQRYPIPRPDGGFEERFWSPLNSPVLGPNGELAYIIHRVEDVTDYIHYKKQAGQGSEAWCTLETRAQQMEADVVLRSQELQRLNEQLRLSEEHFRVMFAAAATGIVAADLSLRLTRANAAFCRMVGYSEAELLSLDILTLTHPDDRSANQALVQELLAGQRDSFVIEKRFIAKAGNPVWSRVSVSVQRDDTGQPLCLVAVTEDITQQRQMANALQESRALARIGGRLGRLGGWAADIHRNEVYWSEEIFHILEWGSDHPPSLTEALSLYPPEHLERVSNAIVACAQTGKPFDLELELYSATGRRFWARAVGEPERNDNGDIVRVIGAFQDISAQKQAESAVEKFATRLRTSLESMTDAFYLLNDQWRFTYVNAEAERVLQRQAGEILGRVVWEAFPAARDSDLFTEYTLAVQQNQSRHFEYYFPPLNEWFEINAYPSPEGLAVYFRVISGRIALEEQLRQAQRLESLGQLTGGVAHDFNNLLTVIMGNTELLAENLIAEPTLRALAEMANSAAQRGAELTQRLLAFARRQALDPRPVDVNQLLANMTGLLRRTLGENIDIIHLPSEDLWPALADPAQLENVLLNLCLNARDAMPRGGKLTLETSNVYLDQDFTHQHVDVEPGHYALIAVSDEGSGIASEDLNRVFEPFFTTKERGKGTGLGLSMAYGFIKQSNGHIDIYSEIGQGTSVKLYLPRYKGIREELPKVEPMTASISGSERILLVEDDDLVRSYVQNQLQQLGYQVVVASNGIVALDVIRQRADIDLLFTDIVMPGGMSGRELGDAARQLRPNLKILYTSGYSEQAIVHQGKLDPGVKLLSKPYRRSDLAQKIRSVLDSTDL